MLTARLLDRLSVGGPLWVWLRNARVWSRNWKTSLVGTIGEPLFYFLGLGYGLSTIVPPIGGLSYLNYVVPGLMLSAVMHSTTIEATYSTFSKLEHQQIHASMTLAPLTFEEIVLGEMLWAVTKGLASGITVLLLAFLTGVVPPWPGILLVGLLLLGGLIFASLGMIVTSLAKSYDSFNYYFTLVISPMFFFSGIFFPLDSLGPWAGVISWLFPLTHLVAVSRALCHGTAGGALLPELAWLTLFAVLAFAAAVKLMAKRFFS